MIFFVLFLYGSSYYRSYSPPRPYSSPYSSYSSSSAYSTSSSSSTSTTAFREFIASLPDTVKEELAKKLSELIKSIKSGTTTDRSEALREAVSIFDELVFLMNSYNELEQKIAADPDRKEESLEEFFRKHSLSWELQKSIRSTIDAFLQDKNPPAHANYDKCKADLKRSIERRNGEVDALKREFLRKAEEKAKTQQPPDFSSVAEALLPDDAKILCNGPSIDLAEQKGKGDRKTKKGKKPETVMISTRVLLAWIVQQLHLVQQSKSRDESLKQFEQKLQQLAPELRTLPTQISVRNALEFIKRLSAMLQSLRHHDLAGTDFEHSIFYIIVQVFEKMFSQSIRLDNSILSQPPTYGDKFKYSDKSDKKVEDEEEEEEEEEPTLTPQELLDQLQGKGGSKGKKSKSGKSTKENQEADPFQMILGVLQGVEGIGK